MKTYMNDQNILSLDQARTFLSGTVDIKFDPVSKKACYQWIQSALTRFQYHDLSKRDKGDVVRYLQKITGYSRQQMTRLISQHRETRLVKLVSYQRQTFYKKYTREDTSLLAEIDELHQTLSGPATKKICERAFVFFGDHRYKRLSMISISHLYNLRQTNFYHNRYQKYTKTQKSQVPIGTRRKPISNGVPGYLRVDSVHQGDQNKCKGVYHINLVDEVTQWEIICTVEGISERFLIPALKTAIKAFPFKIKNFHSDNGSEYINKTTATLLKKLLIEFTKSRSRRTTDNALVESKNGSVIRKCHGYVHIPKHYAELMNNFNQVYLNPYINYHRPCFFPVDIVDEKGKIRKRYLYENMMTPYEKLKSLDEAEQYLKNGINFETLDSIARNLTDNEAAKQLKQARYKLFNNIFEQENRVKE